MVFDPWQLLPGRPAGGTIPVITSVPVRRQVRPGRRVAALGLLLTCSVAAFGLPPTAAASAFAALGIGFGLVTRPRLAGALDHALLILLACLGLLLIPLPAAVSGWLRHEAVPPAGWAPIARDPEAVERAVLLLSGAVPLFWGVRDSLTAGGLRRSVRAVATVGTGLSVTVLLCLAAAAGPDLRPDDLHLAAWPMMALPLCLGLAAGRLAGRPPGGQPGVGAASGSVLAAAAGAVAALAVLVAGSHGAALTLAVAVAPAVACLVWTRVLPRGRAQLAGVGAVALLVALGLADLSADDLLARPLRDVAAPSAPAGALDPPVAPALDPGLPVRRASRGLYSLSLAQGGALLGLALAAALVLLVREGRRALASERSRTVLFVRAGAAAGLSALALLCVWDLPLAAPANAALGATLAAVLVHDREP